jgi:hypothetical protein
MFVPLSSDALDIVCFLVEHDWQTKFSVSHFFPADVTAGLSGRENRTPEAEALLLSVGLRIWAEETEAQALRQTLATLGKAWVGVPLLADQFLGADKATPGARIYAPQRLLDLTSPAIVAADATLVADHTYAPLVVGHITDLPKLEPASGALALCSAILTEDSPWAFRIGVPAAILAALLAGTWPVALLPDWSSPPTQTPVHGLDFARIGQQREQTIADEERAFTWTAEAGFTLCDKTDIATLIAFFLLCRGLSSPFDASLWFTPGTATAEAPHTSTLRFADNTLKIEYTTPTIAAARVKFTQVPWEITGTAGETPLQPPRIFLYQITYDVPGPVVWRFTNCWRPLTRTGDGTYTPAPMEHDSIEGGLDLSTEGLTLDSFLFDGNPLALFNPPVLEGRLWLRVYACETDPIDPDAATLAWFGSIAAAPQTGRRFAADCSWLGGLLDREVPRPRFGPRCNTYFFSTRCGHLKSSFAKAATLSSSSGVTVVVATGDTAAANTYAPGKLELGLGLGYEARSIVASVPVTGGQQLTLDRPLRQAASGQAVTYYRSCDRTMATCKLLDPAGWKGRFRGHPFMPQVNLSLPQSPSTPSGKK